MKQEILDGIQRHIKHLGDFELAKVIEAKPGYCEISIEITEASLNHYGIVHGGFIFTLCDMAAGIASYAYEIENVTQQSSINYLKGVSKGSLYAKSQNIHKGRRTAVNQVTVTDDDGNLIATAVFNMFFITHFTKHSSS